MPITPLLFAIVAGAIVAGLAFWMRKCIAHEAVSRAVAWSAIAIGVPLSWIPWAIAVAGYGNWPRFMVEGGLHILFFWTYVSALGWYAYFSTRAKAEE